MKILLVNPKIKIWNTPTQISLGLASVAAVLEKASHRVEVYDAMVERTSLSGKIKKGKYDLVGITATTPAIKQAWEVAALVKKYSRAKVVLGGAHPSALPEESLKKPAVDLIVRGEGEETILEVCRVLSGRRSLAKVAGISYRRGSKIIHNPPRKLITNLDRLPFPAYHLFRLGRYSVTQPLKDRPSQNARAFYIMTSRGCPFGCTYCFKGIFGRTWRARSPENVLREWEYLVKQLGATEIGVQDDVFNLDKARAKKICDLLVKKKLNHIPWITNNGIRADRVDLTLMRKMKAAGCKRVAFGVESGSQKILDRIQKNLKLTQVRRAFVLAKKAGLPAMGFFMFGNPGEDKKTMEQTIRLAIDLDPDTAHFSVATPFPGTPLYQQVLSQGKLLVKNWNHYGILEGRGFFEIGKVTPGLAGAMWQQAYRRFYLRPGRIWQELVKVGNWLNLPTLFSAAKKYFFS